jgi:hypothetical protein
MQCDENGRRKVRGDVLDDALQRTDSASRGAYRNDVNIRHVISARTQQLPRRSSKLLEPSC